MAGQEQPEHANRVLDPAEVLRDVADFIEYQLPSSRPEPGQCHDELFIIEGKRRAIDEMHRLADLMSSEDADTQNRIWSTLRKHRKERTDGPNRKPVRRDRRGSAGTARDTRTRNRYSDPRRRERDQSGSDS